MDWESIVLGSFVQEMIATILGVLVAFFIRRFWRNWRFGGWAVIVKQNKKELVHRTVSPNKARQVLEEEADLSVFLKGIISPYCQLKTDLISDESKASGLLIVDKQNRQFIVDLDKTNASEPKAPNL